MMIRDGWGSPNPAFRHFFTSNFIPDATPEIAASFDELQRIATSPANALRIWEMIAQLDVSRAGETGARPHSGASLHGRPYRAASGGGARYREAHPGRELHRAAGKQSCVVGRNPRLRPIHRGGYRLRRDPCLLGAARSVKARLGHGHGHPRSTLTSWTVRPHSINAPFHARGHFSDARRAGSLRCWSIRRTVVRYHLAHRSRDAAPLVSSR